ncbi:hypothetical protein FUAX_50690 (plasmid) [Fulvitalea axinellae]|uniref:Secreted protein n=1 Tax=Fulvitalea axinellae TaxID=1182444 RepID=A0AAU9D5I6_9BACT|nr:hypothetical protein FUAX_50690 [Fulvitalea axinellae]
MRLMSGLCLEISFVSVFGIGSSTAGAGSDIYKTGGLIYKKCERYRVPFGSVIKLTKSISMPWWYFLAGS